MALNNHSFKDLNKEINMIYKLDNIVSSYEALKKLVDAYNIPDGFDTKNFDQLGTIIYDAKKEIEAIIVNIPEYAECQSKLNDIRENLKYFRDEEIDNINYDEPYNQDFNEDANMDFNEYDNDPTNNDDTVYEEVLELHPDTVEEQHEMSDEEFKEKAQEALAQGFAKMAEDGAVIEHHNV